MQAIEGLPAEEGPIFMSILPTIALCFLPRLVTRSRTYHFPQPGRETRKNNVKISENSCEKLEFSERGSLGPYGMDPEKLGAPDLSRIHTDILGFKSFDECIFFYFE